MFKISIHEGDAAPWTVELAPGVCSVGRNPENLLPIDNPTVSDRHCEFTIESGGRMHVRDLGSSNGTHLNGRTISSAFVTPGDILKLGSVIVTVELDVSGGNSFDSQSAGAAASAPRDSFLSLIPAAFAFPLKADLLMVILGVTGLGLLMGLLPGPFVYMGVIAGMAIGGFLFLAFCTTLESAARGTENGPVTWQVGFDFGDMKEKILSSGLLTTVCFGLPMLLRRWDGVPAWVPHSLLAAGLLYFPMALLILIMTDDLMSANPLNVVASIFRAPGGYAVVVMCLLPVAALTMLEDFGGEPGQGLKWMWVLKRGLIEFGALYCGFAWARILGLFYRFNQESLEW